MRPSKLLLLAAIGSASFVAAASAGTVAPGCFVGRSSTHDARRVYAIPHGCAWINRPDGSVYSIGPQIDTRINGAQDGAALPRSPIGDAAAVCGFSTFTVSFPRFVVTARRVFWGDDGSDRCVTLPAARAVTWYGRFVWRAREGRRPARWEPVLVGSSAPLSRSPR